MSFFNTNVINRERGSPQSPRAKVQEQEQEQPQNVEGDPLLGQAQNVRVQNQDFDSVLLHNFLSETTQVAGCNCVFCKLRPEQSTSRHPREAHLSETPSHQHTRGGQDVDSLRSPGPDLESPLPPSAQNDHQDGRHSERNHRRGQRQNPSQWPAVPFLSLSSDPDSRIVLPTRRPTREVRAPQDAEDTTPLSLTLGRRHPNFSPSPGQEAAFSSNPTSGTAGPRQDRNQEQAVHPNSVSQPTRRPPQTRNTEVLPPPYTRADYRRAYVHLQLNIEDSYFSDAPLNGDPPPPYSALDARRMRRLHAREREIRHGHSPSHLREHPYVTNIQFRRSGGRVYREGSEGSVSTSSGSSSGGSEMISFSGLSGVVSSLWRSTGRLYGSLRGTALSPPDGNAQTEPAAL
ncbi:hypothetical protein JAAARDRAFT_197300 [Jaapia argillacea MUCL 33604]|uniref:Uncharacterized protein n=1 Tax=Jaapia argillacea MUCL 33604 TaxID=933084 RepID=A0A067PI35_9AGAM|nr:hypothetical protein JAAARDRAFT_197300 [Jaapia argillacea MUCL 33604]